MFYVRYKLRLKKELSREYIVPYTTSRCQNVSERDYCTSCSKNKETNDA
jgi:hypothetical protein